VSLSGVLVKFAVEAGGGLAMGWLLGRLTCLLLHSIDDDRVQTLLTLALASGGFTLANAIGTSGPIAMVVAGVRVGHRARDKSWDHLDNFWGLVDEVLNAVLFVLIGLEVLVIGRVVQIGLTSAAAAAAAASPSACWGDGSASACRWSC